MPEHVPNFVSLKEKYKRTPEMVTDFIREIQVPKAKKNYLHFARIDRISSFDDVEGILFLATPDILSAWPPGHIMTTMHRIRFHLHSAQDAVLL